MVLLFLLGLIGGAVSLILLVVNLIKKKPKKKAGIGLGVSFALVVISVWMSASIIETTAEKENKAKAETENTQLAEVASKEDVVSTEAAGEEKEKTQEEINADIRKTAIHADFVALNGHQADFKGQAVFAEGEVSFMDNSNKVLPTFTITTKENDGYGMYEAINTFELDIKEGDHIKLYGVVSGEKSDLGMTEIYVNEIEHLKDPEPTKPEIIVEESVEPAPVEP